MPRTARSLGVALAGVAFLASLGWIVVRTLVGPDVPVVPPAVELGAPSDVADPDAAPADPPRRSTTAPPDDEAETRAPHRADEAEGDDVAAGDDGARVMGSRTERDTLVVSPPPVSLTDAEPAESPVPSTPAKAPGVAPAPTVPVAAPAPTVPVAAPAPQEPAPAPSTADEPGSTSRALEVDHGGGCAMPDQAGHGLGRAAARTQGSPGAPPPHGQHQRGCSVPGPAERPQPAATLPAQASVRGHEEGDAPGRGGGPGGAGRGRGPKG